MLLVAGRVGWGRRRALGVGPLGWAGLGPRPVRLLEARGRASRQRRLGDPREMEAAAPVAVESVGQEELGECCVWAGALADEVSVLVGGMLRGSGLHLALAGKASAEPGPLLTLPHARAGAASGFRLLVPGPGEKQFLVCL